MPDDEFIDDINNKIKRIPNFPSDTIKKLLKVFIITRNERRKQKLKEKIERRVNTAFEKFKLGSKNPILSFPNLKDSSENGFTIIGTVMAGDVELHPFFLTKPNLTENIEVVGRAGQGKTTFVYYFISQLVKNNISFLFFDVKDDYIGLSSLYDDVLVIDWRDIRFNFWTNIPPGMDRESWYFVCLDALAHSQKLLNATPNHIVELVSNLYEEKKGQFTTQDIVDVLKSSFENSTKRDEYASIAHNRLFVVSKILDSVVNVKWGWPIDELFHKRVVIRMFGLDHLLASLLIQMILLWEFYRRLYAGERLDRKFTYQKDFTQYFTMICMDEAHHILWGGQQNSLVAVEKSPPPMTNLVSMGREFGLSILASTQMSHLLLRAFKDNAGTKIIGNIPDSKQRNEIASSLGMDFDDEKILGKLQKGIWACRVLGRTDTFLLKTPFVKKGNMIAEKELLAKSKPIIDQLEMKRQEIESRLFLAHLEKSQDRKNLPEIKNDAWQVLNHLLEHPWKFQNSIAKSLDLSSDKMQEAKKELLARGYVKVVKFTIERPEVHFILTNHALLMLRNLGRDPKNIGFWQCINSMPSYEHRYFQFLVYVGLKDLGYSAKSEFKLGDRRVDVYAEGEKRIACEIEKSTNDIENKVSVLVDGLVDELVLLYTDEVHLRKAQEKLASMKEITIDKVWIGLARDYIKILREMRKRVTVNDSETSRNEEKPNDFTPDDSQNKKRERNEDM